MRLVRARVQNYRSVLDTDWFDVEHDKTILVGPNEAGKTAVLHALQQIHPPADVKRFTALRDYPRAKHNDIDRGLVRPGDVTVASAVFALDSGDLTGHPAAFQSVRFVVHRQLDNSARYELEDAPACPTYAELKRDLDRLVAHVDGRAPAAEQGPQTDDLPGSRLRAITAGWNDATVVDGERAMALGGWLAQVLSLVDEENEKEEGRYERLSQQVQMSAQHMLVINALKDRVPIFVLFSNYFRVRPLIHLQHLAERLETNSLNDAAYDYGNQCLLKLLGFEARELSQLGAHADIRQNDPAALEAYRERLDSRSYKLNAASVHLTNEVQSIWSPDPKRPEASKLRIAADGQYLKVVVEDELGVEIELDQRSEGFQWLVSFFVVFFAETMGKHANAVLLLDEPGMSLHGLKQREFRKTLSRLAEKNQTLYTTHSPFLVGPDELDLVRVVELADRRRGTKVHTTVAADDPRALLPLQEALGYDLAQSLFAQSRNLVLEGLTDLWYLEAVSELLRADGQDGLNEKIALIPAKSAGKVVYYATILHAHNLQVAALLDSDAAGDQAAKQDTLVHTLGNKAILRTKDAYQGPVAKPEVEDLLRSTLVTVAKDRLGWDVEAKASAQLGRPIIELFEAEITDFSKYKLAKAFVRWTREHDASSLTADEITQWQALFQKVNQALP
jgi:predicted ATP-dependent endonuclease of OLD family